MTDYRDKTLESILRSSTPPNGQQEFRLVAIRHPHADDLTFYIHPSNKDGETGDFISYDSTAEPYNWSATQDPLKDGIDQREIMPENKVELGYCKEDDATCCADCKHYIVPVDDFEDCGIGVGSPHGEWVQGNCDSFEILDVPNDGGSDENK